MQLQTYRSTMLDDELLLKFINTFYGSGNFQGRFWFVGMEEGGGKSFDEIESRLIAWKELGAGELVDLYDFHSKINVHEYHSDPIKLQKTWGQLIRIYLSAQKNLLTTENLKSYQKAHLGRADDDTCLLELMPLVSPGIGQWNYQKWSKMPSLQSRNVYLATYIQSRCDHIRAMILTRSPKVVVFYGNSYQKWWKQIAGEEVVFGQIQNVLYGNNAATNFVISQHPSARNCTNAYFESIGKNIASLFP